ncbi:hypothetical protein APE_1785.1 [Aeropyrum pernix K1]|uniref:Uncharacterized protein n=1 Tax=Aeropyrum pernix (strain ATCC 700893 / DSM 11879 / JCM 9820 / NBRC 100138 / K1) TaxID=272557 RepID=Q9YB10_AERPE|nr:hypothetical protein [Aeropyrum pernix]BAA80788.2 hypothetical protein APE_1785.1 [Aeropyrum pernix K1]
MALTESLEELRIKELLMLITIKKTGINRVGKLYDSVFLDDEEIDSLLESLAKKGYIKLNRDKIELSEQGEKAVAAGDELVDKIVMEAVDYGKNVEEVFGFTPVLPYILNQYEIDVGVAFHVFMEWFERFYGNGDTSNEELEKLIREYEEEY